MTLFEKLNYIRQMGGVNRFHTEKFLGDRQTVFHHSASTALILLEVLGEECSRNLIKAALIHDLPEGVTGDIPAPVKWSLGQSVNLDYLEADIYRFFDIRYPDLSAHDELLLKAADFLDAVFTCLDQRLMGNVYIDGVFESYVSFNAKSGVTLVDFRMNAIWMEIFNRYTTLPGVGFAMHPSRRFWSAQEKVRVRVG